VLDIECASLLKHSIERQEESTCPNWWNRSWSPHRDQGRKHGKTSKSSRGEGFKDNGKNMQARGQGCSNNWKRREHEEKTPNTACLNKQKDEYQAANKCFNCREAGHLAKDCPSKNKAQPSKVGLSAGALKLEAKVRTSSALLKELDKLALQKEALEVSAIHAHATAMKPKKSTGTGPKHIKHNSTVKGY
jgi:hypothetical protein